MDKHSSNFFSIVNSILRALLGVLWSWGERPIIFEGAGEQALKFGEFGSTIGMCISNFWFVEGETNRIIIPFHSILLARNDSRNCSQACRC